MVTGLRVGPTLPNILSRSCSTYLHRIASHQDFTIDDTVFLGAVEMTGLPKKPSASTKRKADAHDPSISPPPMKRQIQSAVTSEHLDPSRGIFNTSIQINSMLSRPISNPSVIESSVASFFTPASQRPKSQVKWEERAPAKDEPTSLLVARFGSQDASPSSHSPGKRKIAAFDLVGSHPFIITSSPIAYKGQGLDSDSPRIGQETCRECAGLEVVSPERATYT